MGYFNGLFLNGHVFNHASISLILKARAIFVYKLGKLSQ